MEDGEGAGNGGEGMENYFENPLELSAQFRV